MSKTKLAVIGGGPGGYVAALRASQLGAEVTLIEKNTLGGTCLNVGCIPTKAMLHPAELLREAKKAEEYGISLSVDSISLQKTIQYKEGVVKKLTDGVKTLMQKNKIRVVAGTASFIRPKTLEIQENDGTTEILEADRIIIATGSVPVMPPIEGLKESRFVVDSTGALSLSEIPKHLLIIGGGVIGIEFASLYSAFGSHVTVVEALPKIIPSADGEMADLLAKELTATGIEILTEHKVKAIQDEENEATVLVEAGNETKSFRADCILCAVGRRANTDDLNAEKVGIKTEKGRILVNEYLETDVPGVYAIGDCIGGIMLAHTASAEGECAAENALSEKKMYSSLAVPSCVYCSPELASVGMTEEEAKNKEISYHVGRFPLGANGRAIIAGEGKGMVKVILGDELDEILGLHIVGPYATELIMEGSLAISLEATSAEIIETIHAHPTVSEALREAVLAAEGRALHIPNKGKKG